MAIGAKLDFLLKHEKMKVSKLSRLTGIPAQTLYAIIRRDSANVDLEILQKICKVMKIGISYFYEDHKSTNPHGVIRRKSDYVKFSAIEIFSASTDTKYYNIATNNTVVSVLNDMAEEKNCKPTDIIEDILTTHIKEYVDASKDGKPYRGLSVMVPVDIPRD